MVTLRALGRPAFGVPLSEPSAGRRARFRCLADSIQAPGALADLVAVNLDGLEERISLAR